MPRTLSQDMIDQKNKDYNRPVELYQIFLDEETLYLAMYPYDIEFFDEEGNPVTYHASALKRSPAETNIETKIDQCNVTIDNVTREMSAYIANTEFVNRRMRILKVFLDAMLGNAAFEQEVENVENAGLEYAENHVVVFDGVMDSPKITQHQMAVTVVSRLDKLDRKLPARTFQTSCPWVFGDESCGYNVPTSTGNIDSISQDYLTINDSAITESSNYWKFGEIEIGKETRVITESGNGYVKVEYPFPASVEAGDSYELTAGCDKSKTGGHGCDFWNNFDFYGGFLAIPRIKNIREVV